MKKSILVGLLLAGTVLFFAPADVVYAKEIPEDGNIPITSEYFSDERLLNCMDQYDKNKDGFLSAEERAAATELSIEPDVKNNQYGIWLDDELDLTLFPNLERVNLNLDSRKASTGTSNIRIKVSGLARLKSFYVYDWAEQGNSDADVRIEAIDFRDTKALEEVNVSDAAGVIFDSENQMKRIRLNHVAKIPVEQICAFRNLERLDVSTDDPNFTRMNVSGNSSLKYLSVESDRLTVLDVTKNTKLEQLYIKSGKISSLNLKKNKKLTNLSVSCSKLASLDISANTKLKLLEVDGTPLKSLNLSKQKLLTQLNVSNNKKLSKLDLSKNAQIISLYVKNTAISSLNLSKQTKLSWLEVTGNKKLTKLDLSKNKQLTVVDVNSNALKTLKFGSKTKVNSLNCAGNKLTTLDLSKTTYLEVLNCSKNKLTSLDLSKAPYFKELTCDKKVKVKGCKGKITRV